MTYINKKRLMVLFYVFIAFNSNEILGQVGGEIDSRKSFSYRPSDWCNKNVPVEYWLSQKQISSLLYLRTKYDEIIMPEITRLIALTTDSSAEQIDSLKESIRRPLEKITKLREKLFELRLEARIEIRKKLSAHQIAFFDDFIFSTWWGYK